MIGVLCKESERDIAQEFFELFKTPWEFYIERKVYDVILSTINETPPINGGLVLIYGYEKKQLDSIEDIRIKSQYNQILLNYNGHEIPVYGGLLTFEGAGQPLIMVKNNTEVAGVKITHSKRQLFRVGYNLFEEVMFLLTKGQPIKYAYIPTLELHIMMLRNWIVDAGIVVLEIPPFPKGYKFIACLTHDVDFVGIRKHKFDWTMWGFIYRAFLGSCTRIIMGKSAWRKFLKNWKAVFFLPFVYLGIIKDFWDEFDRYIDIEKELGSTFYFIPFKNTEGTDSSGQRHKRRAVKYDIKEIKPVIKRLQSKGCEIGLHGIDAWCDSSKGIQELNCICLETGESSVGVRIHWLYFNDTSPKILEEAGFLYDSTLGYNDAVGFRSGTTQVFRLFGTKKLLEMPMHIQDTALFYSSRMGLTEKKASGLVFNLTKSIQRFGGVLTINWHTRSLSPERLWDDFYIALLRELKTLNVWFGTAKQIVKWFNKRRSVSFGEICIKDDKLNVKLLNINNNCGPGLLLRIYLPKIENHNNDGVLEFKKYIDIPFTHNVETTISLKNI